jgi:imidazolonepropionase-like amidohydrolase
VVVFTLTKMQQHSNFLALAIFLLSACAPKTSFDVLVRNCRIVNIKAGTVTENQTIGINADTIVMASTNRKRDRFVATRTIDAAGKYIMPGLWDSHVHFRGGDSLINENKNLLPLFLAFGITTVRDAGGDITPAIFDWRRDIRNDKLKGPYIFTCGPKLDGSKPAWAGSINVASQTDVVTALDSLKTLKADYVKIYDGSLTKEMYYAIIQESFRRGMKVTGHMPMTADIHQAVEYGLNGTEHLYYVLKACSPKADSLTRLNLGYGILSDLADTYDAQLANKVYKMLAEKKVFVTATLHVVDVITGILDNDHTKDSLLNYVGPGIQKTYLRRIESAKRARANGTSRNQKTFEVMSKMVLPMYQSGVTLIAGSDCGPYNSFVFPGQSLLSELQQLTKAGLTPQQALLTSIANGPRFFDLEKFYGSVEKGKVADLIILSANPLEKIDNLSHLNSVIAKGKVFDRKALNAMMAQIRN